MNPLPWREVAVAIALDALATNLRKLYINVRRASYLRKDRKRLLASKHDPSLGEKLIWDGWKHARHYQVDEFAARYSPHPGEAPALSSPIIRKLVQEGRFERAADIVVIARRLDQRSRQIPSFPPMQLAGFNVLASVFVEAGATVQRALESFQKQYTPHALPIRPSPYPFNACSEIILPLACWYIGVKEATKYCRKKTDGTNHSIAAFCTGMVMGQKGGPLASLQAATMLSLAATLLTWGPSPTRSITTQSPERAWWHCNVLNADRLLPDDRRMYALRDRLAHKAKSRGEYDSSTEAFREALRMDDLDL